MAEDVLLQQIRELFKAEREQLRKVVREEVKAETEPITKRLDQQGKQLDQQEKQLDQQGKQLDQQGKIQAVLASNVATVLEEQQQQRTDIRSLHTEVHESEERQAKRLDEAKEEIQA